MVQIWFVGHNALVWKGLGSRVVGFTKGGSSTSGASSCFRNPRYRGRDAIRDPQTVEPSSNLQSFYILVAE